MIPLHRPQTQRFRGLQATGHVQGYSDFLSVKPLFSGSELVLNLKKKKQKTNQEAAGLLILSRWGLQEAAGLGVMNPVFP